MTPRLELVTEIPAIDERDAKPAERAPEPPDWQCSCHAPALRCSGAEES